MGNTDDIPQDILEAARTASREGIRMSFQDPLMPMEHWVTPYVARALLAERRKWEAILASMDVKPLDMWEAVDAAKNRGTP